MKEFIENKLFQKIWLSIVGIGFLAEATFFIYKWQNFNNEMTILKFKEVSGVITDYKDLRRTDYYIWVNGKRYFLPNFKQFIRHIHVGDSLYKPANSMIFQLYRKTSTGLDSIIRLPITW